MNKKKVVIAIAGASGSLYAHLLIKKIQKLSDQYETIHLVMSYNAKEIWRYELGENSYEKTPFILHDTNNYNAPFASGSGKFDTMIIIPCSMGTIAKIASGISSDLISRAADVILKERRKLICVVRETPYNLIHIDNMKKITEAGGIICPATPSFYSIPKTIDELCLTVVDRVLDLAGFEINSYRWGG